VEPIVTERLVLERWSEEHRERFGAMCADPRVMRFIGDGSLRPPASAAQLFEQKLAMWQARGFGWRAIRARADGSWIGLIALQPLGSGAFGAPVGMDPDEIEIGWWIEPEQWGRGYATEGALAVRDEAFERVGLGRIVARLQSQNGASAAVARKIGLRFESNTVGTSGEELAIYALDRPA
jgi:RimJ/RimL family protein N-acetyltransferase